MSVRWQCAGYATFFIIANTKEKEKPRHPCGEGTGSYAQHSALLFPNAHLPLQLSCFLKLMVWSAKTIDCQQAHSQCGGDLAPVSNLALNPALDLDLLTAVNLSRVWRG
ncbi:hypothetical protein BASA60_002933 [Batrachochytrium salamandrivorans]|nr:hypothetical protein BASA60_002933 [Batrachochytrium salamandrivorans]